MPAWSPPYTPAASARRTVSWSRAVEAMVRAGAHAADISVLLGPAVSGRNYEVPAAMAADVEAALARQSDHHLPRHAPDSTSGPESQGS